MNARIIIDIGDNNHDGKTDVTVDAKIGGFQLPVIGPVNIDAHEALQFFNQTIQIARQTLTPVRFFGQMVGQVVESASPVPPPEETKGPKN